MSHHHYESIEDNRDKECSHLYSKGINEPRPRLCIHCKEPEICQACLGNGDIHMCGKKFTVESSKESAIAYAKSAIKVCENKMVVEGPEGSKMWKELKDAWMKHLDVINK